MKIFSSKNLYSFKMLHILTDPRKFTLLLDIRKAQTICVRPVQRHNY